MTGVVRGGGDSGQRQDKHQDLGDPPEMPGLEQELH
jgi:hypothetical protein